MVKKSARKKTAIKKNSVGKKESSNKTPKQAVVRSRNVLEYDPLAWLDETSGADNVDAETTQVAAQSTPPDLAHDIDSDNGAEADPDHRNVEPASSAYGFFTDMPAPSESTSSQDTPMPVEPASDDEAAFGFFDDAPAVSESSVDDEAAFGFFDDAPGSFGMPADQDIPEGAISLGAELTIRNIADMKARIEQVMLEHSRVRVVAASLQKIDTAGLQMLYSLKTTLANNHQTIEWLSGSEFVAQAAASLGLSELIDSSSHSGTDDDEGFGFF